MGFKVVPGAFEETRPSELLGNGGWAVPRWLSLLVYHFEEEQVGQLLDVSLVGEAVVTEDVTVVPKLLYDLLRVIRCHLSPGLQIAKGLRGPRQPEGLSKSLGLPVSLRLPHFDGESNISPFEVDIKELAGNG